MPIFSLLYLPLLCCLLAALLLPGIAGAQAMQAFALPDAPAPQPGTIAAPAFEPM